MGRTQLYLDESVHRRCAVSVAEIWAGVRPGEEVVTEAFFHTRGEVVLDALVAAAATTAGLCLWTLNRRPYPMSGLTFHDGWRA